MNEISKLVERHLREDQQGRLPFLKFGKTTYTYSHAGQRVAFYQQVLKNSGLGSAAAVLVDSRKTFETYCFILACFLSGITFVPVDLADVRRVSIIADDLGAAGIAGGDGALERFQRERLPSDRELKRFAIDRSVVTVPSQGPLAFEVEPDCTAYVMASSGTTGKSKLIPISRRNLLSYLDSISAVVEIKPCSGFSQIAELTFDLSIHDIFLCFASGGFLVPLNAGLSKLALRYCETAKVRYWMSVPSFADSAIKTYGSADFLEAIFFLGEALNVSIAEEWRARFPSARIINLYGPTECTVAATFFECAMDVTNQISDESIIPIGRPLRNVQIEIAEENGELLLGGDQLFNGYQNKADGERKFIRSGGKIFYRSGDRVCWLGKELVFRGRLDFQIKYRGYRFEIEGSEWEYFRHTGWRIVIHPVGLMAPGNYESLWVCHESGVSGEEIKRAAEEIFPSFVRISKFLGVDRIPRNNNGKVDRKRVAELFEVS